MTDTPSFQDLLNDFADEVFVGRSEQLSLFESAIKATKPSFLILNISGQGGVGKSTLLERYRGISKNNNVAYAIANEDHLAIPKILETFVEQLEKDGLDFDRFNERYRKYQELKEKVEADPKVPSGLMDFALRGIAKVGVKSLKRIPIAGDMADVFLSPESEEVIVDQASEFTKYIFQKFTNKDERVLLLETDSELTKYFLSDLTKTLTTRKAILSFDTYEKTSENIEKWLIDLILGEYGQFSSNVLFVIAGRYSLGQTWTRFRKVIRQIELKEFTEEEAKDYLTRSGITDEKLILQFIEISERLPVLLALLVFSPDQLPHSLSGDAVQRFMQGLSSEQREAALISSLPRYFNSDILVSILGDEEGKRAFEWLSNAHFVRTSENGWVYHDVVRIMMLKYFRMRSNEQFVEVHRLLEEYYQKQIVNLLGETDKLKITNATSKFEAEKAYHFLCQNPLKNVEFLIKLFATEFSELSNDSFENTSPSENTGETFKFLKDIYPTSLSQLCNELSDLATKEQLDNFGSLAKLFSSEASIKDSSLYEWLLNIKILDEQEKSILLILSAQSNEKNKELTLALNDFNKAIQLNPSSIVVYIFRSEYFGNNKNFDLALLDLSKAIGLRPDNAYIYIQRGKIYNELKNFPAALIDFCKAVELQPENGDNYYWRGLTYHDMQDYPNALMDATKAIELQPEDGHNYYWRGLTYHDMQDYPNALMDATKAIELQPEGQYNYSLRGRIYRDMKDYTNAIIDFSKAIELQPENGDNYWWRGRTYHDMQDYPNVLTDFSKAIELQPEDGYNYYWRGRTYHDMQDYPNALTNFSKAIEMQPENGYNYYWRGRTYHDMQDYPNALTDFSKAIEMQPENSDNYYERARTYYAMEDYPNTLTDLTKAIELQPENGNNYYGRGRTYYTMKNYPAALAAFSKAIELRPENGENYYWRGRTYFEMKDYPAALEDLSKVIELQPENGDNYYERGRTYYQMEVYPTALIDFTKAIELQPEDGYNYYQRGRTYFEMKDYPAALVDLSKAIELQPENRNNYYWHGRTHYEIREYVVALVDFTKAVELRPENGYNYYRRALCYFALGDERNHYEDVRTAVRLLNINYEQNKELDIAFMIALCFVANQEVEKAKKLYEETIGQCFDKKDLSNALENLKQLTGLIGKTDETEFVLKLFNKALSKLS